MKYFSKIYIRAEFEECNSKSDCNVRSEWFGSNLKKGFTKIFVSIESVAKRYRSISDSFKTFKNLSDFSKVEELRLWRAYKLKILKFNFFLVAKSCQKLIPSLVKQFPHSFCNHQKLFNWLKAIFCGESQKTS